MEVAIHCDCSLLEQLLYKLFHLADKDHRSIHAVGLSFLQFHQFQAQVKGNQGNIFHEPNKQNEYYLKDWGKGLFYHILVLAV